MNYNQGQYLSEEIDVYIPSLNLLTCDIEMNQTLAYFGCNTLPVYFGREDICRVSRLFTVEVFFVSQVISRNSCQIILLPPECKLKQIRP